jgi:hypothetical protein
VTIDERVELAFDYRVVGAPPSPRGSGRVPFRGIRVGRCLTVDASEQIVEDSLQRDDIDVRPDDEKFRELLLLVAEELADDEFGGALKVNKVLYYAEFGHFRATGRPITGARFRKLRRGPAPRFLEEQRNAVVRSGAAEVVNRPFLGHTQHRLHPLRPANREMFSESELQAVREAVTLLRGVTGTDASERSHREPGWQMVGFGEDIPYVTALLPQEQPQPTDRMRARMRELAARAESEGRLAR